LREKRDFGGFCVNGIYEYTRPVMIDGECVAIIFIGNIDAPGGDGRLQRLLGERSDLRGTMEHDFDEERCRAMGRLIESYLHALWEQQGKVGGDESPSLIENIKSYVSANLECDVRLSEGAGLFHYNEQYLGRLFKHKTGMRFSEYLNRERLKRAALYLGDGERVTRAAYQVGFRNVTYFNRVFRAYYGKSPTAYKQENEQKLQL
jgi:YesN/AraC family two-component response regulator